MIWHDVAGVRWAKVGTDYVFVFPGEVTFSVENIREERGDLYAEWHAVAPQGHLHIWRSSLWSTSAQKTVASYLAEQYRPLNAQLEADGWTWMRCIELVRTIVLRERRRAPQPVRLTDLQPSGERWLVQDFVLDKETCLLVGDRGAGKSLIAALIVLCVATGRQIGRYFRPLAGPESVVILDWETTAEEWRERLASFSRSLLDLPDVPETIHYIRLSEPLVNQARQIHKLIDTLQVRLVVIDSALFAAGGDPKDVTAPRDMMNCLASWQVSRLVVIHSTKADARDEKVQSRAYGSVLWEAAARVVWEVRLSRDAQLEVEHTGEEGISAVDIMLTNTKLNRGKLRRPIGLRILYDERELPFDVQSLDARRSPELFERLSLAAKVIEELRSGAQTCADLAEALDTSQDIVRVTLHRLRRRGLVVPLDNGRAPRWGLRYKGGA